MFCTWLVTFCTIRDQDVNDIPIPYKKPYIEMYGDIRDGIISGDFSVETITEFFDITAERLFQDSKDCKLSKEEIRAVAFTVRQGFKKSFDASL